MTEFAKFCLLHPYVSYNDTLKSEFRKKGMSYFRKLKKLLPEAIALDVHYNAAGIACSGDFTFMGMMEEGKGFYISFNLDGICKNIMIRQISHMKDYTGGVNCWFKVSDLHDMEKVAQYCREVAKNGRPTISQAFSF